MSVGSRLTIKGNHDWGICIPLYLQHSPKPKTLRKVKVPKKRVKENKTLDGRQVLVVLQLPEIVLSRDKIQQGFQREFLNNI